MRNNLIGMIVACGVLAAYGVHAESRPSLNEIKKELASGPKVVELIRGIERGEGLRCAEVTTSLVQIQSPVHGDPFHSVLIDVNCGDGIADSIRLEIKGHFDRSSGVKTFAIDNVQYWFLVS